MKRRTFVANTGALAVAAVNAGRAVPALRKFNLHNFADRRRFADTPFGKIAYVDEGLGPAALFLHGFPLNSFQWRDAIAQLSSFRRCLAPDLLGLGFTEPKAGQSFAPASQADMLAAFLDGLGITMVDIVANDSGGAVAQLFVATYPGRVRTLLLTNCDVEPDCPPPALRPVIALAKQGRYAREWLKPWLRDKVLARSPNGLGGMCYSLPGHPTDEAIECYLAPLVANNSRTNAYAIALEKNALAGISNKLRQWRGPVRIIWGAADPIFDAGSPDYLDKLLAGSRGVRRLPAARLFFPEEYPDIIAKEAATLWAS